MLAEDPVQRDGSKAPCEHDSEHREMQVAGFLTGGHIHLRVVPGLVGFLVRESGFAGEDQSLDTLHIS